jgi:hypothetical protein
MKESEIRNEIEGTSSIYVADVVPIVHSWHSLWNIFVQERQGMKESEIRNEIDGASSNYMADIVPIVHSWHSFCMVPARRGTRITKEPKGLSKESLRRRRLRN